MWIKLFSNSKRSILVCCTYHPPSQSDFFNELLTGCDLALSTSKRIVILGDLNCNLLIPSLPNVKSLTSFCHQLKLTELVCAPTRITESSVSQLDVILTNTPDHFRQIFAIPLSISDHHLVLTNLSPRGLKTPQPPKYIKTRNYRKLDLEQLHS